MERKEFVVASGNKGKIKDFEVLLSPLGIDVVPIKTLLSDFDPEETGETFEENAILKAREAAERTGLPCLADDSGLEVDALDGAPGIYSARYADGQGDEANNLKLIREMAEVEEEKRTARFQSVVALVYPDGTSYTANGSVEGRILFAPRGIGGFGYDPLFYIEELGKTMAELTLEEKNKISHRKKAFVGIEKIIREIYGL